VTLARIQATMAGMMLHQSLPRRRPWMRRALRDCREASASTNGVADGTLAFFDAGRR
jgi:hypothetical protein